MSETRLGISIEAQDLTSAKIKTVQQYLRDLTKALGEATAAAQRQGLATSGATKAIEAEIAAQTKLLGSLRASMDASESTARASARLGEASRISAAEYRKSAQEFETSAALILRAQRALDTRPQERVIGRFLNTAQLISAQRAAGGLTEGGMFDAAQILRAQRAVDSYTASLTKAEFAGKALSTAQILAARRRVAAMQEEQEPSEGGILSRIQPRRFMSLGDEFARGQRGQMMATMGAALKDIGISGGMAAASLGGLFALMAGHAIEKSAASFGDWAEQVKAAAAATGMTISEYSALQGAMRITGASASSADASLRMLATSTEKALANSASRPAKAFVALDVSLKSLRATGGDTGKVLNLLATAMEKDADGYNKSAAFAALMGRGLEHLLQVLSQGPGHFAELEAAAKAMGLTLNNTTDKTLTNTSEAIHLLGLEISGDAQQAFINWGPTIIAITKLLSALGAVASSVINSVGTAINVISHPWDAIEAAGKLYAQGQGLGPGGPVKSGADINLPDVVVHPKKRVVPPFDVPKPHKDMGPVHEYQDVLATQREAISNLQRQYELQSEMANAQFISQRTTAKLGQANKELSPTQRAKEDYNAYKAAGEQKLAALQSFQAAEDAAYEKLIAEAMKVYGQDKAQYARAVGEKEAADQEFLVKHQQIINEINSHAMEIVTAHAAAVKEVVDQWGEAFDKMGDQIESSIGEAIKSAIYPMKPEYWFSSRQGQMGQPLIQAHRINPAMQIAGNLGEGLLGDVGKELQSSIMSSLAKSFSGGASSDFGQLIAKSIGAGTPGGIFGSGLGAVQKDTSEITFSASVTTFAAAVTAFAGATATSAAGSAASDAMGAASAVGSAGGIFGFLSKVPLLGSLFSGGAGAAGGAAADAAATVAAFSSGGIVPSAAGGWALGHFPGATPALLHSNEMVLPEHISTGLQGMINRGGSGGGDQHIHFHGPADAPSISKFFRDNFRQNSGAIRQMFRQNSLTPRSI